MARRGIVGNAPTEYIVLTFMLFHFVKEFEQKKKLNHNKAEENNNS